MHGKRIAVKGSVALLSVLLLVMFAPVSLAAEITVKIPVSQEFISNRPKVDNCFRYVLEALTENAPMPAGSRDGTYSFTMEGPEDIFLEIPLELYTKAEYTLYQKVEHPQNNYTYDRGRYKIVLTAYMENGQTAVTVLIENGQGEKAESAHFTNRYDKPSSSADPDVPGTGDQNHIYVYAVLMAGALELIILLLVWDRRKEEERYEEE